MKQFVQLVSVVPAGSLWNDGVVVVPELPREPSKYGGDGQVIFVVAVEASWVKHHWNGKVCLCVGRSLLTLYRHHYKPNIQTEAIKLQHISCLYLQREREREREKGGRNSPGPSATSAALPLHRSPWRREGNTMRTEKYWGILSCRWDLNSLASQSPYCEDYDNLIGIILG